MTTIILSLIAAIGLGGGAAVIAHNNAGGHGGDSAAVETVNSAQNLSPNYELISALTDTNQYELTLATDSALAESLSSPINGVQVMAAVAHFLLLMTHAMVTRKMISLTEKYMGTKSEVRVFIPF